MVIQKYNKAIAAAIGTSVATAAGIYFGLEPEQISTNTGLLTGAINTIITTALVILGPKNEE